MQTASETTSLPTPRGVHRAQAYVVCLRCVPTLHAMGLGPEGALTHIENRFQVRHCGLGCCADVGIGIGNIGVDGDGDGDGDGDVDGGGVRLVFFMKAWHEHN